MNIENMMMVCRETSVHVAPSLHVFRTTSRNDCLLQICGFGTENRHSNSNDNVSTNEFVLARIAAKECHVSLYMREHGDGLFGSRLWVLNGFIHHQSHSRTK